MFWIAAVIFNLVVALVVLQWSVTLASAWWALGGAALGSTLFWAHQQPDSLTARAVAMVPPAVLLIGTGLAGRWTFMR